jgi:PAS domain S-box-containing protein/putative nucleotidyltransferase with HDIG domain
MAHVLITDDDVANRALLETLFSAAGYHVDMANDGQEALEAAKNGDFDLIISDILMPRMDGYRLCLEIRRDPKLRDTPFLFYSANYTEPLDKQFATSIGADEFLVKPQEPQVLLETAARLVRRPADRTSPEPRLKGIEILERHNQRLINKLEQKVTELEAVNARLHPLIEDSPLAIVALDDAQHVTIWNPAAQRLFGWERDEVLGGSVPLGSDALSLGRIAEELRGNETSTQFETQVQDRSGRSVDLQVSVASLGERRTHSPGLMAVFQDVTPQRQAERDLRESLEKVRRAYDSTIDAVVYITEIRDPYTAGHQKRVAELAERIAVEIGQDAQQVSGIRTAALIHDVGKLSVPAEILNKPGQLTMAEYDFIKEHPVVGESIVSRIESDTPLADIVVQHHERLDGSGYPGGLKADHILPEARILAVADVVEAMSSHRPYRPSLGIDAALHEVRTGAGTLYDADIVDVCSELFATGGFEFTEA